MTSVEEGVAARAVCPDTDILIISGVFAGQGGDAIQHRLTPVVWEPWHLDELENAARAAGSGMHAIPVHVEIDTGMSRQGARPEDLRSFLSRFHDSSLRSASNVRGLNGAS